MQRDLQTTMQRLVGIFREDPDLAEALAELAVLRSRSESLCVAGGRTYNPGWNLVFELRNLLTISEAVTRGARPDGERGAHSRLDLPATDADVGHAELRGPRTPTDMHVRTVPVPIPDELRACSSASTEGRINDRAHCRVFRGGRARQGTTTYRVPVEEGMVVLDALHWIQAN